MKLGLQLTWIWWMFSAVMISTPDGLFKVIIACCIDQRGTLSISWWLKSFFMARFRIQFLGEFRPHESEGDFAKIDFRTQSSPTRVSSNKFKIPCLNNLGTVSSNRSRPRIGQSSHLSKAAVIGKIKYFWSGTSCMLAYLVFPWQSRWHLFCCEPEIMRLPCYWSWISSLHCKVAVDPRGDSRVDPQTTLTMFWRNSLS